MTWIQQIFGESVELSHVLSIFIGCYMWGALRRGYYLVRWHLGQDVRDSGSGNVGAKNVGRLLGGYGFSITLLGDFAKGTLAVWATRHFLMITGLMGWRCWRSVMGHIWPLQLGLRGGKGVATSLGQWLYMIFTWRWRRGADSGNVSFVTENYLERVAGIRAPAAGGDIHEPRALRAVVVSLLAGMILLAHRKNLMEEFTGNSARRAVGPNTKPQRNRLWNQAPIVFGRAARRAEFPVNSSIKFFDAPAGSCRPAAIPPRPATRVAP